MGVLKKITIPQKDEKLSEFIGIMLGDGNVGRKTICVSLENPVEFEYAMKIALLIKDMFGLMARTLVSKKQNSIRLFVDSKALVAFLGEIGLKEGDKIKNQVSIPRFIMADKGLLKYCIRGLVDTDGGIFAKDNKRNRIIMEFKNNNGRLLNDFKNAVIKLGYRPSKSGCLGNCVRIQIQKDVIRFTREIGSSNIKNQLKVEEFLITGKIPLTKDIKLRLQGRQAPVI